MVLYITGVPWRAIRTLMRIRPSRKAVCIAVLCSGTVNDFELVLFNERQPSRELAHGFRGSAQPLKCGLIRPNDKAPAQQVLAETLQPKDNG